MSRLLWKVCVNERLLCKQSSLRVIDAGFSNDHFLALALSEKSIDLPNGSLRLSNYTRDTRRNGRKTDKPNSLGIYHQCFADDTSPTKCISSSYFNRKIVACISMKFFEGVYIRVPHVYPSWQYCLRLWLSTAISSEINMKLTFAKKSVKQKNWK